MHDTVKRLDDVLPYLQVRAGAPREPGWVNLARALADGEVEHWIARVEGNVGRRDVASSFLGGWLAAPFVQTSVAAVLLGSRAVPMPPDDVYLHPHPDGWFDGVALPDACLPRLPAGTSDDRCCPVLPDEETLHDTWARSLAGVLTPLFDDVSERGRFGRRGLWGVGAVDRAMSVATEQARREPEHAERTMRSIDAMLRALQRHAPVVLPRARVFPVAWRDEVLPFEIKSSCCLFYKTTEPLDRKAESYCTGCPLIEDCTRQDRWAGWLDQVRAPLASSAV
jgi:hypothetical protein